MINRRDYPKTNHGPLMLNIRVRCMARRRPTEQEVISALMHLRQTGDMPTGWQFMWVDWQNPKRHGWEWGTSMKTEAAEAGLAEIDEYFGRVIDNAIDKIRIGYVRRDDERRDGQP